MNACCQHAKFPVEGSSSQGLAACKTLASAQKPETLVVRKHPSSSGYLLVLTSDIHRLRPYASCVPRSRHEDVLEDASDPARIRHRDDAAAMACLRAIEESSEESTKIPGTPRRTSRRSNRGRLRRRAPPRAHTGRRWPPWRAAARATPRSRAAGTYAQIKSRRRVDGDATFD